MPPHEAGETHSIEVHLDQLLADRAMTLTQLAELTGITVVNLSILKNGRARAIRFTTLTKLCEALRCQPRDLLSYLPQTTGPRSATPAAGNGRSARQ